jgi:hypothetical protein
MKGSRIALALGALLFWYGSAAAQPASIPYRGHAPGSTSETYHRLKRYFSDAATSQFQLVSADERARTMVVKRDGIDVETWNAWAYCKLSPEHLLDTLRDAATTVNVKIEPSPHHTSFVVVKADFEATYGLGSSQTTTQCISKGVLENNILVAAGAKPEPD